MVTNARQAFTMAEQSAKQPCILTGFSKVKITRILDCLELKGLIVRKSYGMTNKIIINRNRQLEKTEEK